MKSANERRRDWTFLAGRTFSISAGIRYRRILFGNGGGFLFILASPQATSRRRHEGAPLSIRELLDDGRRTRFYAGAGNGNVVYDNRLARDVLIIVVIYTDDDSARGHCCRRRRRGINSEITEVIVIEPQLPILSIPRIPGATY